MKGPCKCGAKDLYTRGEAIIEKSLPLDEAIKLLEEIRRAHHADNGYSFDINKVRIAVHGMYQAHSGEWTDLQDKLGGTATWTWPEVALECPNPPAPPARF